jgi:hypothetical protein
MNRQEHTVKEQWKVIEGFERYEVSSKGNVRNTRTRYIQKLWADRGGYIECRLFNGDRTKMLSKKVARLVAKAFLPNPYNLPEVNHKGKKTDNRATMLEWRSVQGNALDTMLRGLHGDGLTYATDRGRWVARYQWMGKSVYVGAYDLKRDAKVAYRAAIESIPYVL